MKKINKIIVKNNVIFYSKAWTQRNEVMHSSEKYRNYIIKQYMRIVEAIDKGDKPSMRTYAERQKLDLEKYDTSYIRLLNMSTVKMMKEAKKERVNDIRNYFLIR